MSARLTVQETADFLRTLDGVLILTHVRPDGDTVGWAGRRICWKTRRSRRRTRPTPRGCGRRRALCPGQWYQ